jgi:hypothetical protein
MVNKIKLLVAFLLLATGIAGFYLLADKATVLRILAVVAGLGAAVAVLWTTPVKKLCKQHWLYLYWLSLWLHSWRLWILDLRTWCNG